MERGFSGYDGFSQIHLTRKGSKVKNRIEGNLNYNEYSYLLKGEVKNRIVEINVWIGSVDEFTYILTFCRTPV